MNNPAAGLLIGIVLCGGFSASAQTTSESSASAQTVSESSTLFKTKCSNCHSFGKGDLVGPDLKAVNERHTRPWLIAWIRSSATLISQGDPEATALFRKYRQQRMPDHELSDAQIVALLEYLAADGPAADGRPRIRPADSATREEIALGESLFFGATRLASGGLACAACHSLSSHGGLGGSLAVDLSAVYPRYLDWALDRKLRQAASHSAGVVERESLALRAFLRTVGSRRPQRPTDE
jgi:mono/diheme cytochrome c family protein